MKGSTAVYREMLPGTDVELTVFGSGVKETLVLHAKSAVNSWVFPLRLRGLRAVLTERGEIELLDGAGVMVARIPHGYMQDSRFVPNEGDFVTSDAVNFELITLADGGQGLKVTADRAWLDDPARVYPVKIDPTTTISTDGDVHIDPDPGTGAGQQNGTSIAVGWDGDRVGNPLTNDVKVAYMAFSDFGTQTAEHPSLAGMRISWAQLNLFHTWASSCNQYRSVYVHPVAGAWTVPGLENSSAAPQLFPSIGDMLITDNTPACNNGSGNRSVGRWVSVVLDDVKIFNAWAHGVLPNYRLALTASASDSAGFKRFTSENYSGPGCENSGCQPMLYLTYTPDTKPQLDEMFPANGYTAPTLRPSLVASASDAQNDPLNYRFRRR